MAKEDLKIVRQSIPPIDAVDKVTGRLKYAVDFKMYHMAYGKILRSEVAHGKIIDIDTAAAEVIPACWGYLRIKTFRRRNGTAAGSTTSVFP